MHTKSLSEVTTTRCRRLKEETLVLLRAQLHSDLTTEFSTVANEVVAILLAHLMVILLNIGHSCDVRNVEWKF